MPIYEYECKECKDQFEILQSMSDKALEECPKCKGKLRKLMSGGISFILKGTGFYANDYPKNK